jgi:hypothetical protein
MRMDDSHLFTGRGCLSREFTLGSALVLVAFRCVAAPRKEPSQLSGLETRWEAGLLSRSRSLSTGDRGVVTCGRSTALGDVSDLQTGYILSTLWGVKQQIEIYTL